MTSLRPLLARYVMAVVLCAALVAQAQEIGDLFASDASLQGTVLLASSGMKVMSGSSVAAGDAAAVLRLARGGEVRVCPRTSLAVASTQSGRDLMVSMNSGALELHYALPASADAVITPDFRILLAGPGSFHFAIAADGKGNTCVRPLRGNSASVIVSELMGDATYQVRPNEQVLFREGRVADPDPFVPPDCGCPPPVQPALRAEAEAEPVHEAELKEPPVPELGAEDFPPSLPPLEILRAQQLTPLPPPVDAARTRQVITNDDLELLRRQTEAAAVAPLAPVQGEVHVQVDAPFVFRATDPEPAPIEMVSRLRMAPAPRFRLEVLGPSVQKDLSAGAGGRTYSKPRKKGIFRRIGAFFASIFR